MNCPNLPTCRLVNIPGLISAASDYQDYLLHFCHDEGDRWQHCRRYLTREQLGCCPDFLMPDSLMGMDEIIAWFDQQE